MKFSLLFLLTLFSSVLVVNAQNWVNGGNNLSGTGRLGTISNQSLTFITNNTERARFTNGGNFGIGTGSPIGKLHVNGVGSFGNRVTSSNGTRAFNIADDNAVIRVLRVDASNAPAVELISRTSADGANIAYWDFYAQPGDGSFRIRDRKSGSLLDRLTISGAGNVGIGTTTPSARLHVEPAGDGGGIYAKGNDGIAVSARSFQGIGVYAYSETAYGVRAECPQGTGIKTSGQNYGVEANGEYAGVWGFSSDGTGLVGSSTSSNGVYGSSTSFYGVNGSSSSSYGVSGSSTSSYGVNGYSTSSRGGNFESYNSYGLVARTTNGYYAGVFYGNMYTSGTLVQASDKNLKSNIQDLGDAMSIINKLKPKNYEFKNDAKYASLNLPKGNHYGLLAQDVQEVLPNLVSESSHELKSVQPMQAVKLSAEGKPLPEPAVTQQKETIESIKIKGVNYIELIPIMVKAMQELKTETDKQIADLKSEISDLKSLISKNGNTSESTSLSGYIKQNAPNPANNNTVISYYTPNNTITAQLLITDMNGRVLKTYNASKGEGQVNISNGELPSGTYIYTLYVNSNKIDSKQMVIMK